VGKGQQPARNCFRVGWDRDPGIRLLFHFFDRHADCILTEISVNKFEYYSRAASNLGLKSLITLERERKFGRGETMRLTSKYLNYPVIARRGSSDLKVFSQILTLREYRCLDDLDVDGAIIDLGANVGYSAAYFLSKFSKCSVVAVEPVADNFAVMNKNLAPYSSRYTAIRAAIMPGADYVSPNMEAGEEWGATMSASKDGIKTISIPELLGIAGKEHIKLLKIDIEGAEQQLFEADTSWLDIVENLVIELHGEACEKAFSDKISKTNFIITRSDELTVCKRPPI